MDFIQATTTELLALCYHKRVQEMARQVVEDFVDHLIEDSTYSDLLGEALSVSTVRPDKDTRRLIEHTLEMYESLRGWVQSRILHVVDNCLDNAQATRSLHLLVPFVAMDMTTAWTEKQVVLRGDISVADFQEMGLTPDDDVHWTTSLGKVMRQACRSAMRESVTEVLANTWGFGGEDRG